MLTSTILVVVRVQTSEDAAEQKAYERNFKSMIEDKRRQRIMAAQEVGTQQETTTHRSCRANEASAVLHTFTHALREHLLAFPPRPNHLHSCMY